MDINPLVVLGIALASIPGPCTVVREQDKARTILQKVLKNQRKVDYLHIESRQSSDGSASWKVKVQTSIARGIMVTILEPSYAQGQITVDDTKETKTYQPDNNRLVVQPSPYQLQPSFDFRWKLIEQNYVVSLGRAATIAGQDVREILIKPVSKEIPVRHMFVDSEHFVVLKYTVDSEGKPPVVVFDTKYVEFGSGPATANFGLPASSSSAHKVVFDGPVKLASASDSKSAAGFSARLPDKLPFGFKVSGAYLFKQWSGGAYVQVKLTDGMVTLTVFQWRQGRTQKPVDARLVQDDSFNVNYGIAVIPGDRMPEEVLRRLVEAFAESSQ